MLYAGDIISKLKLDTSAFTSGLKKAQGIVDGFGKSNAAASKKMGGSWWDSFGRVALGFTIAYRAMNVFETGLRELVSLFGEAIQETGELAAYQAKLALFYRISSNATEAFSETFAKAAVNVAALGEAAVSSVSPLATLTVGFDELAQAGIVVTKRMTPMFTSLVSFTELIAKTTGSSTRQIRQEFQALAEGRVRTTDILIRAMKRFKVLSEEDIKNLKAQVNTQEIIEKVATRVHEEWSKVESMILESDINMALEYWKKSFRAVAREAITTSSIMEEVGNVFAAIFKAHGKALPSLFDKKDMASYVLLVTDLSKALDWLLTGFERLSKGILETWTVTHNFIENIKTLYKDCAWLRVGLDLVYDGFVALVIIKASTILLRTFGKTMLWLVRSPIKILMGALSALYALFILPVALVAASFLVGMSLGQMMVKSWKDGFTAFWIWLKDNLTLTLTFWKDAWDGLIEWFKGVWSWLKDSWKLTLTFWANTWEKFIAWFKDAWSWSKTFWADTFSNLGIPVEKIQKYFGFVEKAAKKTTGVIKDQTEALKDHADKFVVEPWYIAENEGFALIKSVAFAEELKKSGEDHTASLKTIGKYTGSFLESWYSTFTGNISKAASFTLDKLGPIIKKFQEMFPHMGLPPNLEEMLEALGNAAKGEELISAPKPPGEEDFKDVAKALRLERQMLKDVGQARLEQLKKDAELEFEQRKLSIDKMEIAENQKNDLLILAEKSYTKKMLVINGSFVDGIKEGYKEIQDSIKTTFELVEETFTKFLNASMQAFEDSFVALMQADLESLGDTWEAFGRTVQRVIAEILAEELKSALFSRGGGLITSLITAIVPAATGSEMKGSFTSIPGIKPAFMGGWIPEPVVGTGLRSGRPYSFAERGPEMVSKSGSAPMNVNLTIQAVDARSFADLTRRNPGAISGPIISALSKGDKRLRGAIRGTM